jgi:hypothetical protein
MSEVMQPANTHGAEFRGGVAARTPSGYDPLAH